jgi:hypothetical protein
MPDPFGAREVCCNGRSEIAITLSLYGHVMPLMQQEAADTLDQIFEQDT